MSGTYAFYLFGFDISEGVIMKIRNTDINVASPSSTAGLEGIANLALPSIKSIRSYNLGVVYLDRYGRESAVLFDSSENLFNEKVNSNKKTRIKCELMHQAPYWATHYKFFIRELANEYYNVVL